MPAHAEAKMRNSVMARSRTARAERLKLRIGPLLLFLVLFCRANDLSLVQEMRSERDHLFTCIESLGQDGFLLTDGGNFDEAELHFRFPIHDPNPRPATAIIDRADWHQDRLITRGLFCE